DRATQGGRPCLDGAGERPGEQLGVHGDGVAGLDVEGVGGVALARGAPPGRGAPGREAVVVADGVHDVPGGGDRAAVPDRAQWRAADLPAAVVEALAGGVPAVGGAAARLLVVLRGGFPEVGVRMPRSAWAFQRREGVGQSEANNRWSDGGRDLRTVEGTC